MQTELYGQIPHREETALSGKLQSYAAANPWDTVRVAVAYATVAGLLRFLELIKARNRGAFTSQWLFGLDDYLTQPGALRTCLSLPNAELRTARLRPTGRRFHPKLLMVSQGRIKTLACVGSSNLTLGGLSGNCEAYAAVTATSATESDQLSRTWNGIWSVGVPTSDQEIDAYEVEYNSRAPGWPDADDTPVENSSAGSGNRQESRVLTSDSPALDPSRAQTCWIEVGKNTAMGRELEFKAEQALFFGLSPSGGPPQTRTFIVSSGTEVPLRLKYQGNAMWRLQMNKEIPEVDAGLRPRQRGTGKLGRSPFVAVFTRTDNRRTFFLRFIRDDGSEYEQLKRQSARSGTSGSTSTRRYGWC